MRDDIEFDLAIRKINWMTHTHTMGFSDPISVESTIYDQTVNLAINYNTRDFSRGIRAHFAPPENGFAPLSYPIKFTHLHLVNSLTQSSAPLYV